MLREILEEMVKKMEHGNDHPSLNISTNLKKQIVYILKVQSMNSGLYLIYLLFS